MIRTFPRPSAACLALLAVASQLPAHAQQFQYQAGLLPGAVWTEGVECADVDRDGDLDIFFANGDGFTSPGPKRQNVLLINLLVETGSLSFADESTTRLGVHISNAKGVICGDVNGDGWIDCLFTNAFNTDVPFLYINAGATSPGFFTLESAARGFTSARSSAGGQFGDIDDDGDLDLILCDSGPSFLGGAGGKPHLYVNDGNGFFTENAAALGAPTKKAHMDVQLADFNGDWTLDFFGPNRASNAGGNHYLMLNENGIFSNVSSLVPASSTSTYEAEVGDMDGDSDLDMFLVSLSGFQEGWVRNDHNGTGPLAFTAGATLGGFDDDNEIVLIDYDVDGDLDVLVGSLASRERLYRNDTGGAFVADNAKIQAVSDSTLDATVADLNNDRRYDVITAQGESNSAQFVNKVYLNSGPVDDLPPRITATRAQPNPPPTGPFVVRAKVTDQVIDDGVDYVTGQARSVVSTNPQPTPVAIQAGAFVPQNVNIAAGTSVLWTNASGMTQSVASTTAPYAYDSGPLLAGFQYERTFVTPGTYAYQSSSGLTGTVTVTGSAQTTAGFRAGGGIHRFALPDTAGGTGSVVCYELFFTDWAGNVSVTDSACISLCPAPESYCTAKGGLACGPTAIASVGVPSATAASGFTITAAPARSNKPGILLYTSAGRANLPFPQGGHILCIQASPLRRGGPTASGGTPGPNCDGVFTIDWNAFAHGVWVPPGGQTPNSPAPFLLVIGQQVNAQWWGRDTVATGSFMSDALEYRVCP
jgi:plastocyanin